MDEMMIQTLGVALGLALTLMVYSYLLGDNPLYRLAVHLLVGVGMGYASVVIIFRVLYPTLIAPFVEELANELAGKLAVCKVDVDSNQGLAERLGIQSIPTLMVFKAGQPVKTLVGYMPKAEIAKAISEAGVS